MTAWRGLPGVRALGERPSDDVGVQAPVHEPPVGDAGFSFARFARHPFFTEMNRWLVARVASLGPRVVDVACGPGATTELILSSMPERGGVIYAVDASLAELDRARRHITSSIVRFVHGSVEELSRLIPQVDVAIFCNAIHLVADKRHVLAEIRKVLGPGGVLAFNTTYFKGCYVPGTERFWRSWILRAVKYLRERKIPIVRTQKTQAMQWYTPEEYAALVVASGFGEASWDLQETSMSAESLEDISQFALFIEGALPGVPLEIAAEALGRSVREAMRDVKLPDAVPRYWLQFIAHVPA